MNDQMKRIPVILDTDIGDDIDDTWALAMILRSPELDVKLVCSDTHDTIYRAKVLARILEVAGRTDIPVGVGIRQAEGEGPQQPWIAGYDLASYPGCVENDGVGAIIDTILASPEPVTLLCIGPGPNIADALKREPRIAERARFVGMHGSIRLGYDGKLPVSPEYNVKVDPAACRMAFDAAWPVTITPLDTCGLVKLTGEKYQKVLAGKDPLTEAVIENYRIWARSFGSPEMAEERSSTLYDTVAVYLAFAEDLLVMEDLPIRVTDDGYTVIDERAKQIRCATAWKDLSAFEDLLVERLL